MHGVRCDPLAAAERGELDDHRDRRDDAAGCSTSAIVGAEGAAGGEDVVDDSTRCPGRIESACSSSVAVPYSSA